MDYLQHGTSQRNVPSTIGGYCTMLDRRHERLGDALHPRQRRLNAITTVGSGEGREWQGSREEVLPMYYERMNEGRSKEARKERRDKPSHEQTSVPEENKRRSILLSLPKEPLGRVAVIVRV